MSHLGTDVELQLLRMALDDRIPEAHDLAVAWADRDGLGAIDSLVVRLIELLDVLQGVAS